MRGPGVRAIAIAAGGTGGHLFPAEALAAVLIARGHRVVLFTDARASANGSAVFEGLEQHVIRGAGIAGRGARRGIAAAASLARGTAQARRILARSEFGCVVGFGGYPSVPPVLAARSIPRRPAILLQEQNAVLGRANRVLARLADRLALGFADTARVPARTATTLTGNPVRPAIRALAGRAYVPPSDTIHLLVLGGSLGARIFSDIVPPAIAALPETLRARLRITQQCRAEDLPAVRDAYAAIGLAPELAPFFPDIAPRLAQAHLLIARAGASTCAEIAAIGIPSLLVPLPGAIDDHQAANAEALRAGGAATVMKQTHFTPAALTACLTGLLSEPARLAVMAEAALRQGRPDASEILADLVEQQMERVR